MLSIHDRLGDFEIVRLLGKGGMGEVYEARQFNPERLVALKVLAPWLSNDDDSLRRFWKEAEVPANLDHPGIVRIISTGRTGDGVAYYTMHLVRGISLSDMIRRGNPGPMSNAVTRTVEGGATPSAILPETEEKTPQLPIPPDDFATPSILQAYRDERFRTLARIGSQAARALAYAHQQGFLHRDIKPSNLMVDHHDHVYLVDFGLTRGLEPAGEGTQPGIIVGTPWYMSPEQADGRGVDARSDIYSLGVTLYELATQGVGPFSASRDNKQSVLQQVREGQTLPLRALAPGIPQELERIILRAMQLLPGKRYSSAADMARDLEVFCGVDSKAASPLAEFPPPEKRKRRWPVLVGGVLMATILLTIAVAVIRPWNDPAPSPREALDGRRALPANLRTAPPDAATPILRVDNEPLWKNLVFGDGKYHPFRAHLDVVSSNVHPPTLLLLASPDRREFDFTIEIDATVAEKTSNYGGIFFGWQRPETPTDGPRSCFAVQFEVKPTLEAPRGGATIGVFSVIPPGDGRGSAIRNLAAIPEKKRWIAFTHPSPKWRLLKLQVRDQRASVDIDDARSEFTMEWLREQDPRLAENLDPVGGIGVWARHGNVRFRNATITLRHAQP